MTIGEQCDDLLTMLRDPTIAGMMAHACRLKARDAAEHGREQDRRAWVTRAGLWARLEDEMRVAGIE